jgi:hypothetical protein
VLLIGLDVMAHVPLEHPTNFQYKKPANAPTSRPATVFKYGFVFIFLSIGIDIKRWERPLTPPCKNYKPY